LNFGSRLKHWVLRVGKSCRIRIFYCGSRRKTVTSMYRHLTERTGNQTWFTGHGVPYDRSVFCWLAPEAAFASGHRADLEEQGWAGRSLTSCSIARWSLIMLMPGRLLRLRSRFLIWWAMAHVTTKKIPEGSALATSVPVISVPMHDQTTTAQSDRFTRIFSYEPLRVRVFISTDFDFLPVAPRVD